MSTGCWGHTSSAGADCHEAVSSSCDRHFGSMQVSALPKDGGFLPAPADLQQLTYSGKRAGEVERGRGKAGVGIDEGADGRIRSMDRKSADKLECG